MRKPQIVERQYRRSGRDLHLREPISVFVGNKGNQLLRFCRRFYRGILPQEGPFFISEPIDDAASLLRPLVAFRYSLGD